MRTNAAISSAARNTEADLWAAKLDKLASGLGLARARFEKRPTNSNCSTLMRLVKDYSARLRKRS